MADHVHHPQLGPPTCVHKFELDENCPQYAADALPLGATPRTPGAMVVVVLLPLLLLLLLLLPPAFGLKQLFVGPEEEEFVGFGDVGKIL